MAKDIFHLVVREILEDDGWTITHDPLTIKVGGVDVDIDLGAEKVIAAEKGEKKIAVEIKSFLSKSKIHDFYGAKGKYDVYEKALRTQGSDRELFLAIENNIYNTFFQRPLIKELVEEDHVSLFVFNPVAKNIVAWIKN